MAIRRQATLFLPDASDVELIRARYNPEQSKLISAHVTLCREDEVFDWSLFARSLAELQPISLVLTFGPPVREDDFVYLPVLQGTDSFQQLRRRLLGGEPRTYTPHLTLIHPRNGKCTDMIFEDASQQLKSRTVIFRQVSLIEQADGGVWQIL
ncbi:MAG: 2'-5' RNA ligase family protein [Pirellula sp.]|nr:2'-5' RNA ligase family protein [Pirellula sp.]